MSDETIFTAKARAAKAVLRISFDDSKEVTPEHVFKALERALRPTGCPLCGLAGLDVLLRRDLIIPPEDPFLQRNGAPYTAVIEGRLAGKR